MKYVKKLFVWFRDHVIGHVIAILLCSLILAYFSRPQNERGNFFSFSWIGYFFQIKIPLWIGVLFIMLFVIIFWVRGKKHKKSTDALPIPPPNYPFLEYTKDIFTPEKITWSWDYQWNPINRQYDIKNVSPHCQQCSNKMGFTDPSLHTARCSKCAVDGIFPMRSYQVEASDIVLEVKRRILEKFQLSS